MHERISISLKELNSFKRFCDSMQKDLIMATHKVGSALKQCQWDDPIFYVLIETLKVSHKSANVLSGVITEISDYFSKLISIVELYSH